MFEKFKQRRAEREAGDMAVRAVVAEYTQLSREMTPAKQVRIDELLARHRELRSNPSADPLDVLKSLTDIDRARLAYAEPVDAAATPDQAQAVQEPVADQQVPPAANPDQPA